MQKAQNGLLFRVLLCKNQRPLSVGRVIASLELCSMRDSSSIPFSLLPPPPSPHHHHHHQEATLSTPSSSCNDPNIKMPLLESGGGCQGHWALLEQHLAPGGRIVTVYLSSTACLAYSAEQTDLSLNWCVLSQFFLVSLLPYPRSRSLCTALTMLQKTRTRCPILNGSHVTLSLLPYQDQFDESL